MAGLRELFVEEEIKAFEAAGWSFVDRSGEFGGVTTGGGANELERFDVVRTVDNNGAIYGKLFTVRLVSELSAVEAERFLEKKGLRVIRQLRFSPNLFEAEAPAGVRAEDVALELEGPQVVYADPQLIEFLPMRSDPVQSEIGQQWHLGNAFDGAIDAEGALKLISTLHQRRRTRIAIIDNAFDHGHIDFKSRVDARSGFFREEWGRGVKFVTGFNGLVAGSDQVEHGTFCAGMASANSGQSSPGRSGVSPDSELLLVACLIDQVGDQVSLARAIAYAADPRTENPDASKDAGADVISCSLGRNSASWRASGILKDAIGFAATAGRGGRGTPVFWAVQNLGANISSDQVCSLEDVIAVGACARDGKKQKVMAFGKKLAFLAPGVKVFGTMPVDAQGNRTGRAEGTSYAAPCAAGIAALILSVAPDLTRDEVVSIMKSKCVKTGDDSYLLGGRNDNYGFGRVDAKLAVEEARRIAEGSRSGGVIERALRFLGFQ